MVRPVRMNHPVPTAGFIIAKQGQSLAYSADTGSTEEFWDAVSDAANLRGLIVEVSFPNALQKLADITGHLTAQGLALELKKVRRPLSVPIIVFGVGSPNTRRTSARNSKDLRLDWAWNFRKRTRSTASKSGRLWPPWGESGRRAQRRWVVSSAVEHLPYKERATGSIPVPPHRHAAALRTRDRTPCSTHPRPARRNDATGGFSAPKRRGRGGPAGWFRPADGVRKAGWTADGHGRVQGLFSGDRNLHSVSFGAEHHRWVGGEKPACTGPTTAWTSTGSKCKNYPPHPVQEAPAQGPRKTQPRPGLSCAALHDGDHLHEATGCLAEIKNGSWRRWMSGSPSTGGFFDVEAKAALIGARRARVGPSRDFWNDNRVAQAKDRRSRPPPSATWSAKGLRVRPVPGRPPGQLRAPGHGGRSCPGRRVHAGG